MKIKKLVLDTAAFVKNVPVWEYGEEFYSMEAVLEEIKDKATREHVQALPVPVTMREPHPESVRFISEFSQKVGDFSSLSAVDIKVLALTYELEVETKGHNDHLRKTPQQAVTQVHTARKVKDSKANIEGFYIPKNSEQEPTEAHVRKVPSIHELNELTQSSKIESDIMAKRDFGHMIPRECSEIKCCCSSQILCSLSDHLADRSYLLGFSLSLLDLTVLSHILALERKNKFEVIYEDKTHLQRWMGHITHLLEEGEQFRQTSCQEVENFLTCLNIMCPQLVVEAENNPAADDESSVLKLDKDEQSRIDTEECKKSSEVNQNERTIKDCAENCSMRENIDNIKNGESREEFNSSHSESEQCKENEDSDDEGWITPSNIKKLKETSAEEEEEEDVLVACMTADFAMQNVLKQIGLSVLGVNGKVIRHCKTYILRCHACFKTTSDMSKIFCQRCGHKALKKVAVTLNPDGTQKIWISSRPISTRGMKFSLPTPRGGQHALNPVLVADQREAQKMASKLGRKKTDPLSEDYDASLSPFATRDVYSKAAQMGYRVGKNHTLKYWEQHNPNVPLKRTGKKKGK